MAETSEGQNTVDLTTKFGGLKLAGKDALDLFLFLAILALGGITIWEHLARSNEHDQISCQIKLNLYMQAQISDKPIDWRKMPSDLFPCIPRFLFERDQATR